MQNCTEVAAALSHAYHAASSSWTMQLPLSPSLHEAAAAATRSWSPHLRDHYLRGGGVGDDNGASSSSWSLPDYLNEHGVLLTMCPDPFLCGSNLFENHSSESWIQERITGVTDRFVGTVGLALDPRQLSDSSIRCVSPVDAATDQRSETGCGRIKPPSFLSRWYIRKAINDLKNQTFPNTPWEDISCRDLFLFNSTSDDDDDFYGNAKNPFGSPIMVSADCHDLDDYVAYNFTPLLVYYVRVFGEIMGHPVCRLDANDTVPSFEDGDWFMYTGDCSWPPTLQGWQSMVRAMTYLKTTYPAVRVWNEIVLRKPERRFHFKDSVEAVFFTDPSSALTARLEALRFGRKPVLRMKQSDDDTNQPLFECASPWPFSKMKSGAQLMDNL